MPNNKLNGSAGVLAKAIRQVFEETHQITASKIDEVRADIDGVEKRLETKIDQATTTTNKNVQSQLAQHRKDIAEDMKRMILGIQVPDVVPS